MTFNFPNNHQTEIHQDSIIGRLFIVGYLNEQSYLDNVRVVAQNLLYPEEDTKCLKHWFCSYTSYSEMESMYRKPTQKSSFLGEISDNGITAGHINISMDAFKCEREVKYYQSLSLEL